MSTTAVTPPATATNAELARWGFDRSNEHDIPAMRQLWTSETVERLPDRTCHSADDLVRYFGELFAAVPDFHMEVLTIAEQGDEVFVHWRLTGTHQGPLLGIAPTGKRLTIDGMDHMTFRDGKLASNVVVFDQMQWARQIGMLPADGSAADKALKAAFNARTKLAARIKR
jgi:steroid delta-isomerase-like uncharacterized protein